MKNNIKFVYFDIGNVFNTAEIAFWTAAKDFKLKPQIFDDGFDKFADDLTVGTMSVKEFWEMSCVKHNIKNGENYDFAKSWVSDYKIIPEMHELATKIAENYKVGLLTNHYFGNYPEMIKQGKIPNLNYFAIVNSSEVHCKKPEMEIYKIAEERCGYKGDEIFFIDDKKENLFTASKMGWQTFLMDYKNPQKSAEEIGRILL